MICNLKSKMLRGVARLNVRRTARGGPGWVASSGVSRQESSEAKGEKEVEEFDVLVSGGGSVGAAFVARLQSLTGGRVKIGVLEPRQPPKLLGPVPTLHSNLQLDASIPLGPSKPDMRVYALAPRSVKFLEEIGTWDYVKGRSIPYSSMQIWQSTGNGMVRFDASELDAAALGAMAEEVTLQSGSWERIRQAGWPVELLTGVTLTSVSLPAQNGTGMVEATVGAMTPPGAAPGTTPAAPPRRIRAKLLVGADSNMSAVRRLAGVSTWGWSYGQEGVVATVSLANEDGSDGPSHPNHTAFQRYLQTGPLALLPLWDNHCSIVWSVPSVEAARLKSLSTDDFIAELNTALRGVGHGSLPPPTATDTSVPITEGIISMLEASPLSRVLPNVVQTTASDVIRKTAKAVKREVTSLSETLTISSELSQVLWQPPVVRRVVSPRVSFPLNFSQAKQYSAAGMALIGDAAHSIHPQAGQGLNLGLADAQCLADTVANAMLAGEDYSSAIVLDRYAKERYTANLMMMGVVDTIHNIFREPGFEGPSVTPGGVGGLPVMPKDRPLAMDLSSRVRRFIRSAGMAGVQNAELLKIKMAKFAMGIE